MHYSPEAFGCIRVREQNKTASDCLQKIEAGHESRIVVEAHFHCKTHNNMEQKVFGRKEWCSKAYTEHSKVTQDLHCLLLIEYRLEGHASAPVTS